MIFDAKKFHKEIGQLPALSQSGQVLAQKDQTRIKQNILMAIARQDTAEAPTQFWTGRKIFRYGFLAAAICCLVAGTAFASGKAIPGDLLYPVKITAEKVRLNLASNDQSKAQLEAKFAQERIVELQKLATRDPAAVRTPVPPPTTAAPSSTSSSQVGIQSPLEIQARNRASLEVSNALTALKSVQAKLQSRGDAKDAQTIANNILNLQNQAGMQHLLGSDSHDQGKNHMAQPGTATTTGSSQIYKRLKNQVTTKNKRFK